MVGRKVAPAAFRPSAPSGPTRAASRLQTVSLVAGLTVLATALALVSYLVKPDTARAFHFFYGSLFINDDQGPVAVDLASGKPTVRLKAPNTAVGAAVTGAVDVVPLGGENTLLLNSTTGEFNMVGSTGFVVKDSGAGVPLPGTGTRVKGIAAGSSAYIVRSSPSRTSAFLVNASTVANEGTKARGNVTVDAPLANVRAPAASAGGALWLLTGRNGAYEVHQFVLPLDQDTGANLEPRVHGRVTGAAAIAADDPQAPTGGPSGLGRRVAVAGPSAITIYSASDLSLTANTRVPVTVPGSVDEVLPVTNTDGPFRFLYHSSQGWSLVTTGAVDSAPAVVVPLPAIAPRADLAQPAASGPMIYTMQTDTSGALWQISPKGVVEPIAGAGTYPTTAVEPPQFGDAQVVARGSRVVFDARGNSRAVVVFGDGSAPPRIIDKHSAIQIDQAGATSITDSHSKTLTKPGKTPPRQAPPTRVAQPVNNKVDCEAATQTPKIPTVQVRQRGSRSVGLSWTYPNIGPGDCPASTYTVTTTSLTPGSPDPPSTITVNGQDGVTLIGLFPDSEYRLVVTAYINRVGTAAPPVTVRTDVEGPAAPTGVRTRVDSAGNWTVSWTGCTGPTCVPVSDWQIIPRLCDGQGLSGVPSPANLPGDPTVRAWHYTYAGGDALLGRGLSYTVEGVGARGTVGAPGADGGCAYSWSPPATANISVQASAPARTTSSRETTATTVGVRFAGGQTHDLGGVGGRLSYQLLSGGQVVSQSGPTTRPTATLGGITAGQQYQVVVRAIPPRHPEAAVSLPAVTVQPAVADWPVPTVGAEFTNDGATSGTLTVTVGLNGADTRGETFDLINSSFDCANYHQGLGGTAVAPGASLRFPNIDRFRANGTCSVSVQLQQNAASSTSPPLYGAGPSAQVASRNFAVDAPSVTTTQGDFNASFVAGTPRGRPQISVSYRGGDNLAFAGSWSFVSDNGQRNCGSSNAAPTVVIDVDPNCVANANGWTVHVAYTYFLSRPTYDVPVNGTTPAPVDPTTITFDQGTWAGTPDRPQVDVHYTGSADQSTLSSLTWTETVTSNGVTCGSSTGVPSTSGTGPSVDIDYTVCPPLTTPVTTDPPIPQDYTLTITYQDPLGGSQSYGVAVVGTPPQ